jgi:hypothetical protein
MNGTITLIHILCFCPDFWFRILSKLALFSHFSISNSMLMTFFIHSIDVYVSREGYGCRMRIADALQPSVDFSHFVSSSLYLNPNIVFLRSPMTCQAPNVAPKFTGSHSTLQTSTAIFVFLFLSLCADMIIPQILRLYFNH